MQTIFIALVSFVAYATGVVMVLRLWSRRSSAAAHPVEALLALGVLLSSAFLRRPHYTMKYVALCAAGMLLIGVVVGCVMLLRKNRAIAGMREYEEARGDAAAISLWRRWLNTSRAVVDYEFRLLLVACYLLMIGPFAIAFRLGRGRSARSETASTWVPRHDAPSLEAARRPF
jgi:hypothetical protein